MSAPAPEDWESWVGRVTRRTEWLDPAQADRMAATLDRDTGYSEGDALPLTWQWLYFHDVVASSRLGDEGHPALGVTMPPVPLPRRMWAAGVLRTSRPLRLGTEVTRVSTIRSITPKQGSTGPLYFVTVEHVYEESGAPGLHEEQTIVYREMSSETTLPAPTPVAGESELYGRWHLDSTALFRYSALTFNGHRIHYDADYTRETEGYPDLVIHGPLIATLLADLAAGEGRPLAHFDYRARSPLFLPDPFTVHGEPDGEATELWARGHHGGLAMRARAS